MTREEYIDEFKDYIVTMIKDGTSKGGYLEPEEVLDVIEYRLQWLFDNYTFIKKDKQ